MEPEFSQEYIDAFVKGELKPEQRSAFLKAMKEDPALLTAVAETRFALDVADELRKRDLINRMRAWDQEKKTAASPLPPEPAHLPEPAPIQVASSGLRRWMAAAAAVAVLAAAVYFLFPISGDQPVVTVTEPGPQDTFNIFLPYKQPAPSLPGQPESPFRSLAMNNFKREPEEFRALMGGAVTTGGDTDTIQQAIKNFSAGNYDEVIRMLRGIDRDHPDFLAAQVLSGDAFFKKQRWAAAEAAYETVKAKKIPEYTDLLDWNLLMTYLAQYPEKKSRFEALRAEILADPKHPQFQKAKGLAEAMQQVREKK